MDSLCHIFLDIPNISSMLGRLCYGLGHDLQSFLDAVAVFDPLVPGIRKRVILLPLFLSELVSKTAARTHAFVERQPVPGEEHQVCEANLVTDKVLLSGLLEVEINDAGDTLDLVGVAIDGGCNILLWVEL